MKKTLTGSELANSVLTRGNGTGAVSWTDSGTYADSGSLIVSNGLSTTTNGAVSIGGTWGGTTTIGNPSYYYKYDTGVYDTTAPIQWYTGSTITFNYGTIAIDTRQMKTRYLDDKFELVLELAGFKKDEITVKYLAENEACGSKPFVEIKAVSKTHALKEENQTEYAYTTKHEFKKDRELNYNKLTVSFIDGLLTIEIGYAEGSKVKVAQIV